MNEKHLLKKAFTGILPEAIVKRTKHPYRAPIQQSLCNPQSFDKMHDALSESSLRQSGLFDPVKVKHLLHKLHSAQNVNEVDGMALAGIYSTQLLLKYFIENWSLPLNDSLTPIMFIDKRSRSLI
jgi:asparagine synthase (glutamine-hydrolysing)